MADPGFEDAVKGVGQGIAGRLKELAGELLDDPKLEDEGIAQQVDGQLRRAGEELAAKPDATQVADGDEPATA